MTTDSTPTYVADTMALYWYLIGDRKLSAKALSIFWAAERGEARIVLSAISMAELYYIHQKNPLPRGFAEIYADLKGKPYFRFVPFNPDDVLDFSADAAVPEMHDRIIAGLARRLGVPLLTSDPVIVASGVVKAEW